MNVSTMQHPIDLTAFAGAPSVMALDDLVTANPSTPGAPMIIETNFLRYYGLRQNPFADCVHPGVFYRTESHAEAFRDMLLAVEFEASLGMITGPSGTGKTLVTQLLLQHLDTEKYRPILVLVTPGMSKTGLLREILSELEVALPIGFSSVQDLVKLLSNQIIDLHQRGLRLVIIIDECHFLSADCLHVVRTISNLEVPERKLATCLLFAEERLLNRLAHPSYESLRNRMYLRARLEPLSLEDAAQYIKFRLMTAGRMTELFTPEALVVVHEQSGGICRSVNKVCMLSLIEGAARQQSIVGAETVARCAAKM